MLNLKVSGTILVEEEEENNNKTDVRNDVLLFAFPVHDNAIIALFCSGYFITNKRGKKLHVHHFVPGSKKGCINKRYY